jgi:hypothetical protein
MQSASEALLREILVSLTDTHGNNRLLKLQQPLQIDSSVILPSQQESLRT